MQAEMCENKGGLVKGNTFAVITAFFPSKVTRTGVGEQNPFTFKNLLWDLLVWACCPDHGQSVLLPVNAECSTTLHLSDPFQAPGVKVEASKSPCEFT